MSESNKTAARQIMAIFTSGDLAAADNLIGADCVDHEGIPGIDTQGVEGFKRVVTTYRGAFPDVKADIMTVAAEGDRVFVQLRMTGTNKGEFMGMPATGKPVDIELVDVMRFAEGKVVEHWGYSQEMKMMQQLGLMPA